MQATDPVLLESHLGYLMRRVSNRVSEAFARSLSERGVSVSEWVCLVQIDNEPEIMPSKLAMRMGMTQGAVSKVCDKLAAKGWIIARGKESDMRGRLLSLTGAGRQILPKLTAIADANEIRFFGALSLEARHELRNILTDLSHIHNWDNVPIQ